MSPTGTLESESPPATVVEGAGLEKEQHKVTRWIRKVQEKPGIKKATTVANVLSFSPEPVSGGAGSLGRTFLVTGPEVAVSIAERQGWKKTAANTGRLALDVVGVVPGVGKVIGKGGQVGLKAADTSVRLTTHAQRLRLAGTTTRRARWYLHAVNKTQRGAAAIAKGTRPMMKAGLALERKIAPTRKLLRNKWVFIGSAAATGLAQKSGSEDLTRITAVGARTVNAAAGFPDLGEISGLLSDYRTQERASVFTDGFTGDVIDGDFIAADNTPPPAKPGRKFRRKARGDRASTPETNPGSTVMRK